MTFQDDDWLTEGIVFTYPVDQAVLVDGRITGKVLGRVWGTTGQYIVQLDRPLPDAKAIVVHEDRLQLLTCHWCLDTGKVDDQPFTSGQAQCGGIPKKPCPYCTESVVTNG